MKPSERIIKKGEYYEMQVVEDGFYSSKMSKKEQSQSNIQQQNQSIISELPAFKTARANYYFEPNKLYSNAGPDKLLHQLQDILRETNITDQDKQQVLKLIGQVKTLKEAPLLALTERSGLKKKQKQQVAIKNIELRVKLDLSNLESKVEALEKFAYPQISKLQHQIQILLGEKKANHNVALPKGEQNKEDIQNLYATFNSLTCINNLPALASKIHANNGKYVQIANWANNVEKTISFHTDFLAQLKQDDLLLTKLQEGFKQNVATVRDMINKIKHEAAK